MSRQAKDASINHVVGNKELAAKPDGRLLDDSLTDEAIVERVKNGDLASFELVMRRYNQRIFRIVRSIVVDENEAEDVVQETYVRAFEHLNQFEGRALFSTWLTKIAVHEALTRRKKQRRLQLFDSSDPESYLMSQNASDNDVVDQVSSNELRVMLAVEVDQLPADERVVFTMRLVEGVSTRETARCLELTESNVKIRLHRARQQLRKRIDDRIGSEARMLFQFAGVRCDRIVKSVFEQIRSPNKNRNS